MALKTGHYGVLGSCCCLLRSQIGALRFHLTKLEYPRCFRLIEVKVLFSVEEGLTHIHLIGFFISWWVVLEIHDSGVLCAGIIPWEMIVGLKPQIMSVTRRDLRSRHLEVKVYKTFGPLIHMIDSEKHLGRLRPLIRTITF